MASAKNKSKTKQNKQSLKNYGYKEPEYLLSMSHSPAINESSSFFSLIPIMVFSAVVIILTRMHYYTRDMDQFFWTNETSDGIMSDVFTFNKMVLILACAGVVLWILLFRVTSQSLTVKRSKLYIPMAVYALFALFSYFCSQYKDFSLLGWNDRFEGLLPLLAYMVMLFYIINTVNSEKNVKQVIWPICITSALLCILGIFQYFDRDFFETVAGMKLITPNYDLTDGTTVWEGIEAAAANGEKYLQFTQSGMVFQTVYNVNYVSFYVSMLIPIFTMILLRSLLKGSEVKLWKKIAMGALLALNIFNFVGSNSAGGYFGIVVAFIVAIILLARNFKKWLTPLIFTLVIILAMFGATYQRWLPEVKATFTGLEDRVQEATSHVDKYGQTVEDDYIKPTIDYFKTNTDSLIVSINGNPLTVQVIKENGTPVGIELKDETDESIYFTTDGSQIDDDRWRDFISVYVAQDGNTNYIILTADTDQWLFPIYENQVFLRNDFGYDIIMDEVDSALFENHQDFGSGRGYIWSRTIPLLGKYFFVGSGPDTFCAVFPQGDYAGKYSANWIANMVVDKPHNMYLQTGVNCGCIALIAQLALFLIYLVQSWKTYWKRDFGTDFLSFTGAGIFLGCLAFMATALVDDSSVSVMPMFYTFLGLGISINMILKRRDKKAKND